MRRPTNVTTRSITSESASRYSPICGWKSATLIQVQRTCVKAWPAGGAVTKLTAISAVTRAASPMDPTPMAATVFRGKREPKSISKVALANGSAGMSHNQLITSSSHFTDGVHIKGPEAVIDLQDQRQTDGYFGGCHGQNEHEHHLAVRLMPSRPGDHECQPRGIEHDLQGHQNKKQITPYEQTGQTQREQDPRQHQPVPHGYHCHVDSPVFQFFGFRESPGDMHPPSPPARAWRPVPRQSCMDRTS